MKEFNEGSHSFIGYMVMAFVVAMLAIIGCSQHDSHQPIDIPSASLAPPLIAVLPAQPVPPIVSHEPAKQAATVSEAKPTKPLIAKAKKAVKLTKQPAKVDNTEAAALAKATKNAERADCLRAAVDFKIRLDVADGAIADYGNVITAKVCRHLMTAATTGTLVGIRSSAGPGVGLQRST